jgi:threonine dehydratase
MDTLPVLPALEAIPDAAELRRTHQAIKPYLQHTPVLRSGGLDRMAGARLWFKCESFQRVGAFKMRGALRAAMAIPETHRSRGLATHSSGNHAQAVALTARLMGVPAYVVMPTNAPQPKREATKGYGARIVPCAPTLADREATLQRVVAETGATFIPPYDDFNIMAGQASAALELLDEVPDLDMIIAPVGGGGLISGTLLAALQHSKPPEVYAAEPARVDDAFRSLRDGFRQGNERTDTVADGLRTSLGERNFQVLHGSLNGVLRVDEDEILRAMTMVWERLKVVVEPSAAVPFAAALRYRDQVAGKRVGILLSGGNADLRELLRLLETVA